MEPNRFDDVETRIVEEPVEPRPPRQPRRAGPAVLAVIAGLALTGSLAAGASALTSTAQAPTRAVDGSAELEGAWGSHERDGWCRKDGQRKRSSVDY
jgi:hypothetical protein